MNARVQDKDKSESKAETTTRHSHDSRYYQPWLAAQGSSTDVAAHVQDLAQVNDFAINTLSSKGFRPQASRDTTLTAFAQLAALRLNVRRAMVSLLDSTHQYILTEATKTLSLVDDSRHAPGDELWLGSAVLARDDAVCQCAFKRQYKVKDERGNLISATAAVMSDCRLDDEFKDKPYVVQEPGVRFYAGVPIKSRSGHSIGVYAVSSDVPRDPLTYDELRFMQDIADAIMDHLEWSRDRVDRYKGERIVRGMADFIEGAPSMRAMKKDMDVDDAATQASVSVPPPDHDNNLQVRPKKLSPTRAQPKTSDSSKSPSPPNPASSPQSYTKRGESKGDSLTRLLDRAARILRESTLAEGVVFFGPNGHTLAKPSLRAAMAARDKMSGTDDESPKRPSTAPNVDSNDHDNSTDSDSNHIRAAKVLGISLTNKQDSSLLHNTALGLNTLENYFKLYPDGKSMHFSEAGSGLSSEDDSTSGYSSNEKTEETRSESPSQNVIRRKKKIRMSHQELLKNLPGVKNVIFLPLWDYIEEKMVAGCFLWTSSTGRMMNLEYVNQRYWLESALLSDLSQLKCCSERYFSRAKFVQSWLVDRIPSNLLFIFVEHC